VLRHYGKLESAALGRPMEHLVFGHAGAPVLVFPTSKGRFYQWEDFGMIRVLRHHLERGWLQLFCVDSIDELSWYNFEDHQRIQLDWHLVYEQYLIEEFLPYLRAVNATPFLILTGASFGAFHAVNFALRYPSLVQRVVAMSGDYRSQKYVEGYFDEDVLANSPLDYLPELTLETLNPDIRGVEFRLASGRWDFCLEPTCSLAQQLERLGVPQQCHVWDHPGVHDWPLWRHQVLHYL
jgi:esterase/lipase superfamily enzyme